MPFQHIKTTKYYAEKLIPNPEQESKILTYFGEAHIPFLEQFTTCIVETEDAISNYLIKIWKLHNVNKYTKPKLTEMVAQLPNKDIGIDIAKMLFGFVGTFWQEATYHDPLFFKLKQLLALKNNATLEQSHVLNIGNWALFYLIATFKEDRGTTIYDSGFMIRFCIVVGDMINDYINQQTGIVFPQKFESEEIKNDYCQYHINILNREGFYI